MQPKAAQAVQQLLALWAVRCLVQVLDNPASAPLGAEPPARPRSAQRGDAETPLAVAHPPGRPGSNSGTGSRAIATDEPDAYADIAGLPCRHQRGPDVARPDAAERVQHLVAYLQQVSRLSSVGEFARPVRPPPRWLLQRASSPNGRFEGLPAASRRMNLAAASRCRSGGRHRSSSTVASKPSAFDAGSPSVHVVPVTVQRVRCQGPASSAGIGRPWRSAVIAAVRKSCRRRPCRRQVSRMVSSRSTRRSP